jgi:1,4-dihydroxy-2-naphthoate octaprenyltransferase
MNRSRRTRTDWGAWWRLMRPHTLTAAVMPVLTISIVLQDSLSVRG